MAWIAWLHHASCHVDVQTEAGCSFKSARVYVCMACASTAFPNMEGAFPLYGCSVLNPMDTYWMDALVCSQEFQPSGPVAGKTVTVGDFVRDILLEQVWPSKHD